MTTRINLITNPNSVTTPGTPGILGMNLGIQVEANLGTPGVSDTSAETGVQQITVGQEVLDGGLVGLSVTVMPGYYDGTFMAARAQARVATGSPVGSVAVSVAGYQDPAVFEAALTEVAVVALTEAWADVVLPSGAAGTATMATTRWTVTASGTLAAGTVLEFRQHLVGQAFDVGSAPGPFFDGDTTPADGITYQWFGPPGVGSPSAQMALPVSGWEGWSATPTQRTGFGWSGDTCVRAIVDESGVAPALDWYAEFYAQNTTAGATYTFSAYVWSPAGAQAYLPVLMSDQRSGGYVPGPSGTVEEAWERLSVTFVAQDSFVYLGFSTNAATPEGTTYYLDGLLLEEGDVLGDYFDGNTPGYSWIGEPDNSVSVFGTPETVADPEFSVPTGTYTEVQTVTITDATTDVHIRYTLDGSTPDADINSFAANNYVTPFDVAVTTTVQAIAFKVGSITSAVATAVFTLDIPVAQVETPTFSIPSGTYPSGQQVWLSEATVGAEIRYTMDGSTPTETSDVYYSGGPFYIYSTETLKAIGVKAGAPTSEVATAVFTIEATPPVEPPVFSPPEGAYTGTQTVTLTDATSGAEIYYIPDASDPNAVWTLYTAPFDVVVSSTVRAFGSKSGAPTSDVVSAVFTIEATLPVEQPTFSPVAGTYTEAQTVTLTDATSGASIYYTLDGTDPTEASTLYEAPLPLAVSATVKAIGVLAGSTTSAIASATFVVSTWTSGSVIQHIGSVASPQTNTVTIPAETQFGDLIVVRTAIYEGNQAISVPADFTVQVSRLMTDHWNGASHYFDWLTVATKIAEDSDANRVITLPVFQYDFPALCVRTVTVLRGAGLSVVGSSSSSTEPPELLMSTGSVIPVVDSYGLLLFAANVQQEVETLADPSGTIRLHGADNMDGGWGNGNGWMDGTVLLTDAVCPAGVPVEWSVTWAPLSDMYPNTASWGAAAMMTYEQTNPPRLSVVTGTYPDAQTVTLTDATAGAAIYYTLDGSTPDETSILYTEPLTIAATTTIKAIGVRSGIANSVVATAVIAIVVSTPQVSPAPGTYDVAQTVTLTTTTSGASIFFTLDGSAPSTASTLYTDPISVATTTTIKAVASGGGGSDSDVVTAVFTIVAILPPTISPTTGTYDTPQTVTLTEDTLDAAIYYTLDGSTPDETSTLYVTSFVVTAVTTTVMAIGVKAGSANSSVTTATITIPLPEVAVPVITPATGTYPLSAAVTITDATESAEIRYRLDGYPLSDWDGSFTLYTGPFVVTASANIMAIGVKAGYTSSVNANSVITIPFVSPPVVSPASGTYYAGQAVLLSAAAGTAIYYTLDGSIPDETSTLYTGPFVPATGTTTLQVIAFKTDFVPSVVTTATLTILDVGARKNLFTNPNSTTSENEYLTRRNQSPGVLSFPAFTASGVTGTVSASDPAVYQITATQDVPDGSLIALTTTQAPEAYVGWTDEGRVQVRRVSATPCFITVSLVAYDAASVALAAVTDAPVVALTTEWQDVVVTAAAVAPSGAVTTRWAVSASGALLSGAVIEFRHPYVGNTFLGVTPKDFFDGDTLEAGDGFTYHWDGTPGASSSWQGMRQVVGWSGQTGQRLGFGWSGDDSVQTDASLGTTGLAAATLEGMVDGRTYTFSAYVWSDGRGTPPRLYAYDANNTTVYGASGVAPLTWERLSVSMTPGPSSYRWAGLSIESEAPEGTYFIDGVLLEETAEVKPYFDGDTIPRSGWRVAWTGDPDASVSTASPPYAPTIEAPADQSTVAGVTVTLPVTSTCFAFPAVYTADNLPIGLSINPATGTITGTPSVAGAALPVTVTLTDNENVTVTASFLWLVTAPLPVAPGLEIEIYAYDDPKRRIDVLPHRWGVSYLDEIHKTGGGGFSLWRHDPKVLANSALLDWRNVVKIRLNNKVVGAFLIQSKESDTVSSSEAAGEVWKVTGEGLRTWFHDAIVLPHGGLNAKSAKDRMFNFGSERGDWYKVANWKRPINAYPWQAKPSALNPWGYGPANWPDAPGAVWIWGTTMAGRVNALGANFFRYEFDVAANVGNATYSVFASGDDEIVGYIDGAVIINKADYGGWHKTIRADFDLSPGHHVLAFRVTNVAWQSAAAVPGVSWNPGGLLVAFFRGGDPATNKAAVLLTTTGQLAGWLVNAYPNPAPGWTPGEIVLTLLREATARGVTFPGFLFPTFTSTTDSHGVPWAQALDWSFTVGMELFDVLARLEEVVCDVWINPETLELNMYAVQGLDHSTGGDPVKFEVGHNVVKAKEDGVSDIKNALVLDTSEGWAVSTDVVSNSVATYGIIEGLLSTGQPVTVAKEVAKAVFSLKAISTMGETYDIIDVHGTHPFVDFAVGDWVLSPDESGLLVATRVRSLSVSEDSANGMPKYAVEFGTIYEDQVARQARWLKSLSMMTLGIAGSVANASGTGNGGTGFAAGSGYYSPLFTGVEPGIDPGVPVGGTGQTTAWTQIAVQPPWYESSSPHLGIWYRLVNGVVWMKGNYVNVGFEQPPSQASPFILPPGYRPGTDLTFLMNTYTPSNLSIFASGVVVPETPTGYLRFDNISFLAEN